MKYFLHEENINESLPQVIDIKEKYFEFRPRKLNWDTKGMFSVDISILERVHKFLPWNSFCFFMVVNTH